MRFAVAFGGVVGAAVLALAGARPAAALSVQDFQNLPQTLGDSADLKRYMTGFRDALYDFNRSSTASASRSSARRPARRRWMSRN